MESILFTTPILWIGYAVALFLCVFDLLKKTSGLFSALSLLITVCTTTYALILGASIGEASFVVLCFLLLNLLRYWGKKE